MENSTNYRKYYEAAKQRDAELFLNEAKQMIRAESPHTDSDFLDSVLYGKKLFDLGYGTPQTLSIVNVIFNDPATIVFWSDGTKTVVKKQEGDSFDPEKGLAMAISKKMLGNKGCYFNLFKTWIDADKRKRWKKGLKKIIRKKR